MFDNILEYPNKLNIVFYITNIAISSKIENIKNWTKDSCVIESRAFYP